MTIWTKEPKALSKLFNLFHSPSHSPWSLFAIIPSLLFKPFNYYSFSFVAIHPFHTSSNPSSCHSKLIFILHDIDHVQMWRNSTFKYTLLVQCQMCFTVTLLTSVTLIIPKPQFTKYDDDDSEVKHVTYLLIWCVSRIDLWISFFEPSQNEISIKTHENQACDLSADLMFLYVRWWNLTNHRLVISVTCHRIVEHALTKQMFSSLSLLLISFWSRSERNIHNILSRSDEREQRWSLNQW
jgi:hypothetical protein